MDLVKSHISGRLFLWPVPCSPSYSSIFLQLSWGLPASDREVYKRPSEDVSTTEVSQDATRRGHLTPEQDKPFLCPPGAEAFNSTGVISQPRSPSAFVI